MNGRVERVEHVEGEGKDSRVERVEVGVSVRFKVIC